MALRRANSLKAGAGHETASLAPAATIVAPCAGGTSHNEAESTRFAECTAGAQVPLDAVLQYDRELARGGIGRLG